MKKFLVIERSETFTHSEATLREYLKSKPAGWTFRGPEGSINGFPKSRVDYAVNLTETPVEKGTSVIIKIDGAIEVPVLGENGNWRLAGDVTTRRANKYDVGKRAFVYTSSSDVPSNGDAVSLSRGNAGRKITAVTTDGKFAVEGLDSLFGYAWVLA